MSTARARGPEGAAPKPRTAQRSPAPAQTAHPQTAHPQIAHPPAGVAPAAAPADHEQAVTEPATAGQTRQTAAGKSVRRPTAAEHAAADAHSAGAGGARSRGLSAPVVLGLQRIAGNAAVNGYLRGRRPPAGATAPPQPLAAVQRLAVPGSCPAPPITPMESKPEQDPRFRSAAADVTRGGKAVAAHPPPAAEAKAAQDAAVAPAEDKEAQAKAAQADKMSGAKPGTFDKAAFIAAVNQAVAAQAPKNLDEADKFAGSGKADTVKTQVLDKVTKGKDASAKDIAEKSTETPDASKAVDKPVTPLPPQPPPPKPAPPDPAKAAPAKAPAEQTELGAAKCETNTAMADAGVTEPQLAHSNESDFTGALKAKKEGEAHSAAAPAAVRQQEAQQLSGAQAAAASTGKAGVAGMVAAKTQAGQKLSTGKSEAKAKDEAKRAEITAAVKKIFDTTKADVDKILGDLDGLVAKQFEEGEARAKAAFTSDHKARMQRYKDERYSGAAGWARWTGDLFTGLPAEANQLFLESKKLYESQMQQVISDIADTVGRELGRAKDRIAAGRTEIAAFVAKQPKELQSVGSQAAKEFGSQLDQLEETVADKSRSVVDDLAQKYVEARNAVDEEIKALQAENKGLWDKAKDAVGGVIETITKLKDMLLGVLARAAGAIDKIIKDPIGFLGNLVNAVKGGIVNFGHNIVDHLKKGLQGWLLGALASTGIELPDKFDLKGIVKLILSLLGLTWANIRARILKVIPEPVLKALESTVAVVGVLVSEGVGGLWKWIVEKISDLKEMVLGQIKEFVVEKIVKAGITWLISLLNPAAAFIKACKMIYDVIMFFVDKAAQIKEFVDSVLDSVESIASGGVGAVAGLIEKTLAKILPLMLGFLASLLGLGGISEKIKKVLETVQKPVMKVVDTIIGGIVKAGKGLLAKLMGRRAKPDAPDDARSTRVRALVRGDLQSKMRDGMAADSVAGIVRSIYAARRAEGLKALEVVPTPHKPGSFQVQVTASAPKPEHEFVVAEPEEQFTAEDIRLQKPVATSVTGTLSWPGGSKSLGKIESLAAEHAEARLLALVRPRLGQLLPPPPAAPVEGGPTPTATITLKVTRSPCPNCAREIAALPALAAPYGWTLKLAVNSVGLYAGTETDPVTKLPLTDAQGVVIKGDVIGIKGLEILRAAGAELGIVPLTDATMKALNIQPGTPAAALLERKNQKLLRVLKELADKAKTKVGGQ